ncbi:hypothetical protein L596_025365 [Steinernema carpocapsae]|uniref:Uncharacterized protein n=1 Tax=Steinernema carpocapsae TaxID=34508 RepID=A0A4U5M7K3_STECR|nr:hypothetical protein L596_025365 [Steinernema carpocapsae]
MFSHRQAGQLVTGTLWEFIQPIDWSDWVEACFEVFTLVFMVLATFECTRVLICHYRSNATTDAVNRRVKTIQLISTLAYITPPNLFLIRKRVSYILHGRPLNSALSAISVCNDLFAALFIGPQAKNNLNNNKLRERIIASETSLLNGDASVGFRRLPSSGCTSR